jgi:hypothetical protein
MHVECRGGSPTVKVGSGVGQYIVDEPSLPVGLLPRDYPDSIHVSDKGVIGLLNGGLTK